MMKLKIELKSDTCIGNGTGQGSVVDIDTYYHENGLPFIPSKRIKGLLRESALELKEWGVISQEEFDNLFEDGGEGFTTLDKMKIYDAQIDNYVDKHTQKNLYQELCQDIQSNELFTKERVLDYYTYVRYQSAMENGVAQENSLRSMRVVKKGTVFYEDIYNVSDIKILNLICHNLRHMGMNRTRGYGEIEVSVIEDDNEYHIDLPKLEDEKEYKLILKLYNDSPIIVAKDNSSCTTDYISGSTILGYFAGQYLKNHEANQRFTQLFIDGLLCFDNAYITNSSYDEYVPNPLSLNKVKDGTIYHNKLTCDDSDVQLSRIHDKYVSKHMNIMTPLKEVIYHHTRPDDKSIGHVLANEEGNGTFYQLEALSQDQHFLSFIRGKGKDLKELYPYINGFMTLGKSKNTQYGRVTIKKVEAEEIISKTINNQQIVAQLISPTVILNENTLEESLNINDLMKTLSTELQLTFEKVNNKSFVNYTTLSGYNRKWNLPKPVINAFKEGSVLLLKVNGAVPKDVYIGENKQEGCGHIRFSQISEHEPYPQYKQDNEIITHHHIINKKSSLYQYIYDKVIKEKILELIMKKNIKHSLNSTTISRVLLMCQDGNYEQFLKNVKEIKDIDKLEEVFIQIDSVVDSIDSLNIDQTTKNDYYIYAIRQYFTKLKYEKRQEGGGQQ